MPPRPETDAILISGTSATTPHDGCRDVQAVSSTLGAAQSSRPPCKQRSSEAPSVHFRPVAAGEVVLDGRSTPLAVHLRERYNDAAAV
jgi:hypothetical protein